ncbi:MAG: PIG-L family deacetylase [Leptospiraceae bacterium]|nr:PIG-L family deacetylase [Leptospiraceae bacterium]MCK6380184.1 PIG-L family deacetylase [Leptospiraceae bacterium]NUM41943.1 PIG-L family deacetylase [Leptospiraceae bacterium]
MKILCVGSHPDDVELSMGGTILRMLKNRHEVTILDLSNGEPTPFGSIETRKKESRKASDLLGVKRIELDFPNRFILDTVEGRKKIAEIFREVRPEIIFTHYEFDSHPDHTECCKLVEASKFYSKLSKSDISGEPFFPKKILYYFPNHIKLNIHPSFLVDIGDFLDKKKEIMECYESQFIKNGNGRVIDEFILLNRYFGLRIGKLAAEPFFSRESLDITELSILFS